MYRRRTPQHTAVIQSTPPQNVQEPAAENHEDDSCMPETAAGNVQQSSIDRPGDLLNVLWEDKEKTLIILLIILLSEDGADTGVILALMYCIL